MLVSLTHCIFASSFARLDSSPGHDSWSLSPWACVIRHLPPCRHLLVFCQKFPRQPSPSASLSRTLVALTNHEFCFFLSSFAVEAIPLNGGSVLQDPRGYYLLLRITDHTSLAHYCVLLWHTRITDLTLSSQPVRRASRTHVMAWPRCLGRSETSETRFCPTLSLGIKQEYTTLPFAMLVLRFLT